MTQTKKGALKAAKTIERRYGKKYWEIMGRAGGKISSPTKGFGSFDPEKHKAASSKGGTISRRTK